MNKRLTLGEKDKILELVEKGAMIKEIADQLKRDTTTISKFLKNHREDRENNVNLGPGKENEANKETSNDSNESGEEVYQIGDEEDDRAVEKAPSPELLRKPIRISGQFRPTPATSLALKYIKEITHSDINEIINQAIERYAYTDYNFQVAIITTKDNKGRLEAVRKQPEIKENEGENIKAIDVLKLVAEMKKDNKSSMDEILKMMMMQKIQNNGGEQ